LWRASTPTEIYFHDHLHCVINYNNNKQFGCAAANVVITMRNARVWHKLSIKCTAGSRPKLIYRMRRYIIIIIIITFSWFKYLLTYNIVVIMRVTIAYDLNRILILNDIINCCRYCYCHRTHHNYTTTAKVNNYWSTAT